MPLAKVIGDFLLLDNFTYERCDPSKPKRSSDNEDDTKTYWRCRSRNDQGKKCRAGAITDGLIIPGMTIAAKQISRGSGHNHLPSSQTFDAAAQDSKVTSLTSSGSSTETASRSPSISDSDEAQSFLSAASPSQIEKSTPAEVDCQEQHDTEEPTSCSTMQGGRQEVHLSSPEPEELQQDSVGSEADLRENEAPEVMEDAVTQQNDLETEEIITGDVSEFCVTQISSLAEEMLFMEMKNDPLMEAVPEPVAETSPTVLQQENPLRIKIQGLARKRSYASMQTGITQRNTSALPSCQQPPVPSETSKAMKSKKRKVRSGGFAKDVHRYHRFLIELMRNPIFLKENIMRALEVVYRTEFSVMAAYVTVLENKERILNDLQALINNPEVTIYSLHGKANTSVQTNPLMQDILNSDKILQCLRYPPTESVMPLDDRGPDDLAASCPRSCERANMVNHTMIPPVPAAVPIRDLMQNRRFVPLVDLENDSETILDLSSGIKVENGISLRKEGISPPNLSHGVARLLGDFNCSSATAISSNQSCNRSSFPDRNIAMARNSVDRISLSNHTISNEMAVAQHVNQKVSLDPHPLTPGTRHRVFCFVQKCGRAAETKPRLQMPTQDDASFSMHRCNQINAYPYSS